MRRLSIAFGLVSTLFTASVAVAQTVSVGNLPGNPNFGFNQTPVTLIDLSNPANASGNLTDASFTWSATPCPAAAKIKFFRPSPNGSFVFLAERGPFDVGSLTSFVFLSPPVAVQAGDLIGITRLTTCGSPVGQTPGAAQGFPNATLSARATGNVTQPPPSTEPAAVVPVVGSTPGALGQAFFRTSVQLFNPGSIRMTGRLVYHPAGAPAMAGDPFLSYSLEPGETRAIGDLLPAMGLTGLGSLDVFPDTGTATPFLLVRVFNDAGAGGTTGFVEEAIAPARALVAVETGFLISPPDTVTDMRMNEQHLCSMATSSRTRDSMPSSFRNVQRTPDDARLRSALANLRPPALPAAAAAAPASSCADPASASCRQPPRPNRAADRLRTVHLHRNLIFCREAP